MAKVEKSKGGRASPAAAPKRVPQFWWDFAEGDLIIVQSDDDRAPVIERFAYDPGVREGAAAKAIERAEALIADLKAGRQSPFKRTA